MTIQLGIPFFSPVSRMPIPTYEPNGVVLFNNVADYLDPTTHSDYRLTVRAANSDIVNNMLWLNYIQSCGYMA